MFEKDVPDLPGLGTSAHSPVKVATHPLQIDLTQMSVQDLLALRSQIEQRLPARDLKDMNLAREMVLQMLALQQLQQTVLSDPDTPANQQAQVANSLSAALVNLVKLQSEVNNSERFKKVEAALIETLSELPTEAQEKFLKAYERTLEQ